jgi:aminoglycoside phosphotransferase family enzyme/predicted kinase
MDTSELRERLRDPRLYGDGPAPDDLRETHLSFLVFVGERVHKWKKSVDLGFCDFSTLERRRRACGEELRLNARLSPDMYLGLLELRRSAEGAWRVVPAAAERRAGEQVLEVGVEMLRLPAEGMLAARLERGELDNSLLDRVAERLVRFHRDAERGPQVDRAAAPDALAEVVLANYQATRGQCGDLGEQPLALAEAALHRHLEQAAQRFLSDRRALLEQRIAAGCAVDGHGDLHAENICLDGDRLWIYDCIEFEPAFRRADVACDLAFLCMDLDLRGYRAFAGYLAYRYAQLSGDGTLDQVLPFFKGHRALVRAKVEGLVAGDAERSDEVRANARERARAYFNLAASYTLPPALVLTCGLPATGKSWLGERVARALGGAIHKSDVRRKQLAGLAVEARRTTGYDQGLYTAENKQRTYDSLLEDARVDLSAGRSVVIDGSFLQRKWREPFANLARELGAPLVLLELRAEVEEVKRRIERRSRDPREPSEADFEVYLALQRQYEPPTELHPDQHLIQQSGGPPAAAIGRLLERVRRQV